MSTEVYNLQAYHWINGNNRVIVEHFVICHNL